MERVSTNMTLFYKFFIPIFWIVFIGAVTLTSLFYQFEYIGNMPALTFRIIMSIIFLLGLSTFLLTFMRLKRVEMAPEFIYVTNYFKTARYPYHNVEKVEVRRFFLLPFAIINLKQAGSFGKRLFFIPSKARLDLFMEANPALKELMD